MTKVLFGHDSVSPEQKTDKVNEIFTGVADVYDTMNDAMSIGIHRLWKQQAVSALDCSPDDTIADLSCGTGDISALMIDKIPYGKLYCIDPNPSMLAHCQNRLKQNNVTFIESTAESMILNQDLDKLIVSFGLRNFSNEQQGLENIFRSLKVGGKAVIMEFNPPSASSFANEYTMYLKYVIPCLGRLIGHNESSYQYLADSISVQPDPSVRTQQLKDIGFEFIRYTSLTMNTVGLWEVYRCHE